MTRITKSLLFLMILTAFSSSLFAQEPEKTTQTSMITDGVTLEHTKIKEMIGSFDKLFIEVNGKKTEIFDSEGRTIKQVIPVEGIGYVISMDCGGSGGYFDIVLLVANGESWTAAWEDTLAQPTISIEIENGKKILMIEHFVIENDAPKKTKTKVDLKTNQVIQD